MITLLTLLIATASASSFYPVGKTGAKTTYTKISVCAIQEAPTPCWDITGLDLRYMEPGTKEVDDFEQPIFEAESVVTACTDLDSCSVLLSDTYCVDGGGSPAHFPVIADDFSRVYCTRLLGYVQVTVDALVINQALKDAADAADAATIADRVARAAKRDARLLDLETCATTPNPNAVDTANCMRSIAKELVRDRLLESEL